MIQPLFGFIEILGIGAGIVAAIIIGGLIFIGSFLAMFCLRKVKAGEAGVRTGLGGIKVTKSVMLRIPFVHRWDIMDIQVKKLEVARKGKDGLICMDNIRADIEVAFYVRVRNEDPEIIKVAEMVGCERASEIDLLKELFEAKFSDALKAAGKQMEFANLYTERTRFRDMVVAQIGDDLNGYMLEDVAIDYLEQTAREDHDPNNVLDSQGIEKINRMTAEKEEATNLRTQQKEVKIIKDNNRAEEEQLELHQQLEVKRAEQERVVKIARAEEEAEAETAVQEQHKIKEQAKIKAAEEIEVRDLDKKETVETKGFTLQGQLKRAEQEAIKDEQTAAVDRERFVELAKKEKEAVVIKEAFAVAESEAGLQAKLKEKVVQEQLKKDEEYHREAERAKHVMLVEATAKAEASQTEATVAAEAEKTVRQNKAEAAQIEQRVAALAGEEAAKHEAERLLLAADAESKASEKRRHAAEQDAEGLAAHQAASKLAEARGVEAMAKAMIADAAALEAQGTAEATVTDKKGDAEAGAHKAMELAEAEGTKQQGMAAALAKTEMAKAIELFNKASADHEEFRLQLDKDKAVDLAAISVQKDIADAQARVVGEALKSANIDIVGGENDFFEKVVRSVSQGKSVDRLVNNSQAITDVKNTFFNGDPDYFKTQLRTWISDLGITSEAVKNLTVSALLTKLVAQSDDSGTKSLVRQAQQMAKESGLMDTIVGDLLGKGASK